MIGNTPVGLNSRGYTFINVLPHLHAFQFAYLLQRACYVYGFVLHDWVECNQSELYRCFLALNAAVLVFADYKYSQLFSSVVHA